MQPSLAKIIFGLKKKFFFVPFETKNVFFSFWFKDLASPRLLGPGGCCKANMIEIK